MTYQWADHEVFPAQEGGILFGIDQGSLFFIDEQTRLTLSRWGASHALDLNDVPDTDREILEELASARFLRPSGTNYVPSAADSVIGSVPLTTMVLEVAQDCNLRCTYCYAGGGAYGKQARLMDAATARTAVRRLISDSGDKENITLVLFGGEPLLNMAAVKAAVEEAETGAREAGKKVFISLTTNGTLLDAEIIDFIHTHKLAVAVSLDGPEDLHDANRPDCRGEGSYAGIVAQLAGLFENASSAVAARVTLKPEQWLRVEEVFFHLLTLGFHEVGIAPVSPISRELLPDSEQEEALFQGFSALAAIFVKGAVAGKILPFTNLIDLLARLHMGQTKSISCGAGYGYFAADTEGSLYLCHRLVGEDSFRVGDLADGADQDKIRTVLDSLNCGRKELCISCWARTLCSGGCHYENNLRETHLGLPAGSSCSFIRRWFRLGIEVYAELRRSGADDFLEKLEKRVKC